MKRKNAFVLLIVAILLSTVYFLVQFYIGDVQVEFNSQTLNSLATPDHWNTESDLKIPLVVHHTWKRTTAPPSELVRWRTGCMNLNRDYTFIMYNDEDLLTFTRQHYQQYLPMFEHLHGVYMADMARVLLAYHFGGIYMDLDFYCHRPFKCLLSHVRDLLQQQQHQQLQTHRALTETVNANTTTSVSTTTPTTSSASVENTALPIPPPTLPKDVLVVSREPLAHAVLFRNKTRVVIQDFFLSTPKHPFFLWLLNDRWDAFTKSNAYPLPNSGSSSASGASSSVSAGSDSSSMSHTTTSNNSNTTIPTSTTNHIRRALSANHTSTHTNTHNAHSHKHHVEDHRPAFAKGPFSYSIEKDIDRYLQYKKDKHTTATTSSSDDAILELHEDRLHALVDSTNSRLQSTCQALQGKEAEDAGPVLAAARKEVCKDMSAGRYFKPTTHSIMVHMWTHVYLGWSFVRGLYNAYTYHVVESTLPQTMQCF